MSNAIDAINKAYADATAALATVDTVEDRQVAFELAAALTHRLEDLTELAVALRKRCVRRIWEAEELSLAGLAGRVGVSKTRAEQLVKTFRTAPPREGAPQ
jgi:hypothetical protein